MNLGGSPKTHFMFQMENPLVGIFNRERTILTFRQRSLEFFAAWIGIVCGGGLFLMPWLNRITGFGFILVSFEWSVFFGALIACASIWAMLMFTMIRFDCRKRTFSMRTRIGLIPKFQSGSIDEVRHLELAPYGGLFPTTIAQSVAPGMLAAPVQFGHLYVIRLHWQQQGRAPIVVEHVQMMQGYGVHDSGMMNFAQKAQQYSNALKVPLYSNIPLPGMQRVN